MRSPKSHEDLIGLVKADRLSEVDCIFSVGGDGTAHTIAQQLIGAKTKLLVLPGGTANDLAEELGTNSNIRKLAGVFHARTTKKIDIIRINDRYLMTNGGLGIAQEVAKQVNLYRKQYQLFNMALKLAGKNAYKFLFAKEFFLSNFKLYSLYVDSPDFPGLDKKIQSPLVLVNNQPKLAGRFAVAPFTKNNDGKFNVTIFTHTDRLEFGKCVLSYMNGIVPANDKNLIYFETDSLDITSLNSDTISFFGDGEVFPPTKDLSIRIIPSALEVFSTNDNLNFCGGSLSLDKIPLLQ